MATIKEIQNDIAPSMKMLGLLLFTIYLFEKSISEHLGNPYGFMMVCYLILVIQTFVFTNVIKDTNIVSIILLSSKVMSYVSGLLILFMVLLVTTIF